MGENNRRIKKKKKERNVTIIWLFLKNFKIDPLTIENKCIPVQILIITFIITNCDSKLSKCSLSKFLSLAGQGDQSWKIINISYSK